MAPVSVSITYDKNLNAVITKVFRLSESLNEYVLIFEEFEKVVLENTQSEKVWLISDYSMIHGTSIISAALLANRAFRRYGKIINDRTIERIVVLNGHSAPFIYVSIFNAFLGKKARVFKTMDEAQAYIIGHKIRNGMTNSQRKTDQTTLKNEMK